eukprot:c11566_g1_i1 orf=1-1023(-)
MTGALKAEAREGVLHNGLTSLLSEALSSPTLSKKISHVNECVDEAGVPEINAGQSHLLAADEASLAVCRVCQCSEADKTGEASLKVLGISVPSRAIHQDSNTLIPHTAVAGCFVEKNTLSTRTNCLTSPAMYAYVEMGLTGHVDTLMELGCACKSDLALAHYACALRWFVSRGSVICEICGKPALNVNPVDWNKVLCVLRGKDVLQQAQVLPVGESGETNTSSSATVADLCVEYALPSTSEELLQVTAWFDPVGNTTNLPRSFSEQAIDVPDEGSTSTSPTTKWAVEGVGVLIATGLLTVTITWLLSPRVDKSVARRGLNVLLGGLCALSIVVFLRFGVLP